MQPTFNWSKDVSLPVSGETPEARHAGSTGAQVAARRRGALSLQYRQLLITAGPMSDDEAGAALGVLPRSICSTRNGWGKCVKSSGTYEITSFGTKRVRWKWIGPLVEDIRGPESIAAEPGEVWAEIDEFEGRYDISSTGRVWSRRNGLMRRMHDRGGYPLVHLHRPGVRVVGKIHVLVARAFIGPKPHGLEIGHKDGNKENSCVSNLEYITHLANVGNAVRMGTHRPPKGDHRSHTPEAIAKRSGERNGNSKTSLAVVVQIKQMVERGQSVRDIATALGVPRSLVYDVRLGRTWKWAKTPQEEEQHMAENEQVNESTEEQLSEPKPEQPAESEQKASAQGDGSGD